MANGVAVVASAVLIVGAIGVGLDRCGSGSGPGTATDAERVCQEIVERVLRSPAAPPTRPVTVASSSKSTAPTARGR